MLLKCSFILFITGNKSCVSEEEFLVLVEGIIDAYKQGAFLSFVNESSETGKKWELKNAIFFATTVVTTIGI